MLHNSSNNKTCRRKQRNLFQGAVTLCHDNFMNGVPLNFIVIVSSYLCSERELACNAKTSGTSGDGRQAGRQVGRRLVGRQEQPTYNTKKLSR